MSVFFQFTKNHPQSHSQKGEARTDWEPGPGEPGDMWRESAPSTNLLFTDRFGHSAGTERQ